MNRYLQQAIQDIIEWDFAGFTMGQIREMGYDYEKLTAEGSTWIVYVYDCFADYYQKNKARIDRLARQMVTANN